MFLSLSVLMAQQRSGVYATNTEPSQSAAYIFEVNFDSELQQASQIEIIFPPQFNIQNVVMASSSALDGGLKAEAARDTLKLSRVNGSNTVPSGQLVDLKLATLLNPSEPSSDYTFTVLLKNDETVVERQTLTSALNLYERVTR